MPAKFRIRSPLKTSQPWYLVPPLALLWVVLGTFFWICAGVWLVARFLTQQVQRGLKALTSRRAA